MKQRTEPTLLQHLLVAVLLPFATWVGLHVCLPGTTVGILWPPSGLALGFLLRWGPRLWPSLLVGSALHALLVQWVRHAQEFTTQPGQTALLILFNTASAFLVPLLAERLVRMRYSKDTFSLQHALVIFVRGGLVAQAFSAAGGVAVLWGLGLLPGAQVPRTLFVWWASNVTSVGLLAVWMAALSHGDLPAWRRFQGRPRWLFLSVVLGTTLSFFLPGWLALPDIHLELLVVFPVLMTAFALGISGAATAALLCAIVTLVGTLMGHGAFAHSQSFNTLLSLQVYLLTIVGASLALGDTRRRWIEAQTGLEHSEAWFREVFHGVHDAVVVLDPSRPAALRVDRANRRSYELLGSTEPAQADALASGPLEPRRIEQSLSTLAAGGVLHETWQLSRTDGCGPWVDGTLQALVLGGERRLLYTLRDITDRKTAEAEGERLRSQLLQAQKMEALGLLSAGIAHDFNNLLTALMGYTELLRSDPSPTVRQHAERQWEVLSRGTELARALLSFGRPDSPGPQLVDLHLQVAAAMPLLRHLAGRPVDLSFTPAPGTALLEANPSQLDQVLVNLACNARDAMPEGGRLELATELSEEGWVTLTVRDTGIGMDEATQARIFEPFFTTKATDKGTGLGLATVFDIVKGHRGTIRVESTPGEGTTFLLTFPKQG